MRPFFGPLHLLLLAEAFAHHFVHRRFHKSRRDCLAVTISLTVIRDQMPVVHDIGTQLRQRLDQWQEPGIGRAEVLNSTLQVDNLAHRAPDPSRRPSSRLPTVTAGTGTFASLRRTQSAPSPNKAQGLSAAPASI